MKIAVIAPTEIPARRANTIQVIKMTQALTILGHEASLVSPFNPSHKKNLDTYKSSTTTLDPHSSEWNTIAHHYGLKHYFPIKWLPSCPRWRSYDYSIRSIIWAKKWNVDILYTRLPQVAAIASILGMPTILEIHDLPQGKIAPSLFRLFMKGKGAERLVVITQALANDLEKKFSTLSSPPFTIIAPDGVDLERYTNLPTAVEARKKLFEKYEDSSTLLVSPSQFIAGYTGHLYPGRGTGLLLTLAANLPEIVFLIVGGESQDVTRLKAEINQQGLNNIILTGFIPNAELPLFQAACDVLLMPYQDHVSASSGGDIAQYLSPMKLFEYLASERPIISSDLLVLREILNPQNAVLIPVNDHQAWVNQLKKLKTDQKTRNELANQARQDAQLYTWEKRASCILEGIKKK